MRFIVLFFIASTVMLLLTSCESVIFKTVELEVQLVGPAQKVEYRIFTREPNEFSYAKPEMRTQLFAQEMKEFEISEPDRIVTIPGTIYLAYTSGGSVLVKLDTSRLIGTVVATIRDMSNPLNSKKKNSNTKKQVA